MSTLTPTRKIFRATGLLLIAVALLTLSAVTVAYMLRHTLAVLLGDVYLSPYGIELRAISGLHMGFSELRVDRVDFVIIDPDNNEQFQESRIEGTRVTFTLDQLLIGRVVDVEIASLSVLGIPEERPENPDTEDEVRNPLQLEAIVAALQSLPLDSIRVGSFSMPPYLSSASITMVRDYREVSVRVATEDFEFSLQTNWHDTAFVSSYFIPDDDLPDHVFPGNALTGAMRLYFREQLGMSADFSLGEADSLLTMDGTGQLQLSALIPFLQHHELFAGELAGYEGTLNFSASVQEQARSGEEQRLDFAVSVLDASHASGRVPVHPGDADATFLWSADQPLSMSGTYEPESGTLNLAAQEQLVTITLLSQTEERHLTLELANFSAQCTPDFHCTATQSSTLQIPFVTSGAVALENLSAVTSAQLTTNGNAVTAILEQGSRIAAGKISAMDTTLTDVNLLVLETLTFGVNEAGDLHAQSHGAELYLPSILVGENSARAMLNATDLLMHWPGAADSQPEISATLQLRNLGSDVLPVVFRKPEIDATVALANNSLRVDSQIRLADRNILLINATHSLDRGAGAARLEVPPLQFDANQSMSQLFFSMPYEADLVSGVLAATADLRWYQDDAGQFLVSGPLSINAHELSGFHEDMVLLNLTTTLSGELTDWQFISDDNLRMQIGSIDPGLPLENISFDFNFNTTATTMEMRNVQATMFDGTLSSTGLAYNWSATENLFALALDRIDLSRLLAMGAYEGLNATGLISGAMPVRIAGTNVSVHGGTLRVVAPGGSIGYQPANPGPTGNPALDLVNQALSNYQYDVMDAEVDYLPSGELILAVKLEGFSPAVNEGQPININLNVTDNIPALLESLQASRDITDALQRQLDER